MPFDTLTESLYGDYNAIIDQALGGDPSIKDAVARADTEGRRGLQSLKYYLKKHNAFLSSESERLLAICEADQEYYDTKKDDLQNIEFRGGKYRASVTSLGVRHRRAFDTLAEAQEWRDKMLCFFQSESIDF